MKWIVANSPPKDGASFVVFNDEWPEGWHFAVWGGPFYLAKYDSNTMKSYDNHGSDAVCWRQIDDIDEPEVLEPQPTHYAVLTKPRGVKK